MKYSSVLTLDTDKIRTKYGQNTDATSASLPLRTCYGKITDKVRTRYGFNMDEKRTRCGFKTDEIRT